MSLAAIKTRNKAKTRRPSASLLKTFQRMRLYDVFRETKILTGIEVGGAFPRFCTTSWSKYWRYVPKTFEGHVRRLGAAWRAYIDSGHAPDYARPYCRAYLQLLRALGVRKNKAPRSCRALLQKVLGFENFVLSSPNPRSGFAAATTSFRNPVFLSLRCQGDEESARNDPSLLALLVANHRDPEPRLFYHYRKQQILENMDKSLLFFPAVELERRAESFGVMDAFRDTFLVEWDPRVKQRSGVLANKVIIPLLKASPQLVTGKRTGALRILDIGSGTGLLTSRIIRAVAEAGVLGQRKIELSLLDVLSVNPKRHFATPALVNSLAKVESVSSDYIRAVSETSTGAAKQYDMTFLFRILHNMSSFRVTCSNSEAEVTSTLGRRYKRFAHLSDYYRGISLLFPQIADQAIEQADASAVFYPLRVFNPQALVTQSGESLIGQLARNSNGVLIEDCDLLPGVLVRHLADFALKALRVYDLSRALRLSLNHIYWITTSTSDFPLRGEKIWPR